VTTDILNDVFSTLEVRRQALGMSTEALARRSGVSRATVCRILGGEHSSASFWNVMAVAEALGLNARFEPVADEKEYLEQQAEKRARYAVGMVQGTMGLEDQGVDTSTKECLVEETKGRLLAGSKRKLWR
jgi:transcriptional regulator with XRE-family HTH domain